MSATLVRGGTPLNYIVVSTSAPPAPPAVPLTANDRGYVRVEMRSGSVRCSINSELVACQTSAGNWPAKPDGGTFHTVSVNADGEFHWVEADLGALDGRVTLDDQTYTAQGWTVTVSEDGMRFANDRTGHGMSVSDQRVEPF
ncbi:MAG TPA: hypothetical protein VIO95_11320 [Mycobacterium sp.]